MRGKLVGGEGAKRRDWGEKCKNFGWRGHKKATASEVDAVAKKYNITINISALVRGTYQPS